MAAINERGGGGGGEFLGKGYQMREVSASKHQYPPPPTFPHLLRYCSSRVDVLENIDVQDYNEGPNQNKGPAELKIVNITFFVYESNLFLVLNMHVVDREYGLLCKWIKKKQVLNLLAISTFLLKGQSREILNGCK